AAEPQTLKMKIEGMTCGMCCAKVEKQLSSLCQKVHCDHQKGEAVCTGPSGTLDQIVEEAGKTGFKTFKLN
ncbi:MAG: heavy-metal-associated domain-containing protein, partial [Deltaproteobacteria bacterium]|nr:heavy-metal-associated domain-containing protein [Deltaproteobacteria bacterium]